MAFQIHYFAWLRERIGQSSESYESKAKSVSELLEELKAREERYALAFSDTRALKVAVNQQLSDFNAALQGDEEIAFFPPMTGG